MSRPYKRHPLMDSVQVDPEDEALLNERGWNVVRDRRRFYVQRVTGGRVERFHRTVMGIVDPKTQVDHRDGNGLNNRRSNLRVCDASRNQMNRGATSSNTSGFKGVSWSKKCKLWQAQITKNRKNYHLGFYDTPENAHLAYLFAGRALHGEFFRAE